MLQTIRNLMAREKSATQTTKGSGSPSKILSQIQKKQTSRTRQDISRWRTALQAAENQDRPSRTLLYELYADLALDNHLSSLLQTRKQSVLGRSFQLVDTDFDRPDRDQTRLLQRPWFYQFMDLALDSLFWGHSLVEFGPPQAGEFQEVFLVPRANVVPERQTFKLRYTDREGAYSYTEPPYNEWVVEIGSRHDLGLLARAAPSVIWKKNALAAWSEYTEIFGMPIRIGKTDMADSERVNGMEQMLRQMGSAAWAVFDESEDIEFVESRRNDPFQVYDQLVERCNSELSKLLLGQTMTTDSGSSRAQAEVHERVLHTYSASDARLMADYINWRLLPFLKRHGYALEGLQFQWED